MGGSETTVRLRDQRKPGHGWFDNEIYDVFGDELGQGGISVYMTLARLCYGTTVRRSLREMAAHARMSKDTFARNLKRVTAIGLVMERKGATANSASTYELVDAKELATRYMRAAMEREKAKSVSRRDTASATTLAQLVTDRAKELALAHNGGEPQCLTVRHEANTVSHEAHAVEKKICAEENATEVSQNCTDFETQVSHDVRHLRQDTRTQNTKQVQPPVAPASGGCVDVPLREVAGETVRMAPGAVMGAESLETVMDETERRKAETERRKAEAERRAKAAESPPAVRLEAQLLWAVAGVMRAFSLAASRNPDRPGSIEMTIHDALALHCSKTGATPETAAQLAMRMRKEFLEARPLLRHGWGWKRWFAGGHWCDSATWPYDREAVRDAGMVLRVPGAMRL